MLRAVTGDEALLAKVHKGNWIIPVYIPLYNDKHQLYMQDVCMLRRKVTLI